MGGLRTHSEIRVLKLNGCHLGPAGSKMLRNVIQQNNSLIEIDLSSCALHDAGLDEIATGLAGNSGRLEILTLCDNCLTHRKISKLVDTLCEADNSLGLTELIMSRNPLGFFGAKEMAKILG